MDTCSCCQKVRRQRLRRRFADPLSTNNKKSTPCRIMSWHSSSPSPLKRIIGRRDDLCYRSRRRRYSIFLPWLGLQGRPRADSCCGMTPLLQILPLSWYGGHPSLRGVHIWMVYTSIYFLFLEPSTQVWSRNHSWVWTRDPRWTWARNSSGVRARNLHAAPCRWLPARTRSRVEASYVSHRARLWWSSCDASWAWPMWFTL